MNFFNFKNMISIDDDIFNWVKEHWNRELHIKKKHTHDKLPSDVDVVEWE